MQESYIKLGLVTLFPAVLSVLLYLLNRKTSFGRLPRMAKQVTYGILFGALAVLGTEWGIPINGAQMNCRDAAVLSAGLLFGAPAGLIAGVIGGVERWIAVAWGVGSFTRLACSLSTLIAGVYAAALRRFMFENKKPGWMISLAIGIVMEIFHLTMVFITNMRTPIEAMSVVRICTVPMVVANGVSVMLAAMALAVLSREGRKFKQERVRISQTIQRWLLVTVTLAFFATSYFVFSLQSKIALSQTDSLLDLAVQEIVADVEDASDEHLLSVTRQIASKTENSDLQSLAQEYHVAEISLVDSAGIITESTMHQFIGYDMASGTQSAEFLCLLRDRTDYVQSYGPISYDPSVSRKYAGVRTDTGFIQVGYDAEQFQQDIDTQIAGMTKNRHVGKTGFILILDEQLNMVSAPKDLDQEALARDTASMATPEENTMFRMPVNGSPAYCRYRIAEGFCIMSVLPEAEALQMRNIALYVNTFMEILVFAVLFGLIYLLIKRVVVNQLKNVNRSLAKITGGDLDEVVDVRTNAEFASLSDDINSTVNTLKRYISEASARIDRELEFAKNIQSSALPSKFPAFPKRKDFDIYASMNPAKEVGGDFYDFYMTHEDTLHFLIADVSGKGIPAAMFMMRAKTELKSLTEAEMPLCEVFTNGNRALCEGNDAGMFVTAWQGGLDLKTGRVRFANAGHNPPLVRHGDGSFAYLKSRAGFVLAGMEGITYREQEIVLEPGDTLYLYTDGVTEAQNADGELFGEERLLQAINACSYENMQELCSYITECLNAFVGEAAQFDDITMVALRYLGTPPVPSVHFDAAKLDDIPAVTSFAEAELEKLDCPMKTVVQMNIAIDEIFSNIVRYGYPQTPGPVTVELIAEEEPRRVSLRFTDEGIPYNPLTKEDPDVTLSAEERKIGGLGIYMVKKSMDDMKYEYENEKNILTITKKL